MSSVGAVSIASEEAAVLNILAELQAEAKDKRESEDDLKKCCPSIHRRKQEKAQIYKRPRLLDDDEKPPPKKIVLCDNGKEALMITKSNNLLSSAGRWWRGQLPVNYFCPTSKLYSGYPFNFFLYEKEIFEYWGW